MRELQIYKPAKWVTRAAAGFGRVQFDRSGEQLLAQNMDVGDVYVHSLSTGETRSLNVTNPFQPDWNRSQAPVVSPDVRYLITQFREVDQDTLHRGLSVAWVTDLATPDATPGELRIGLDSAAGFAFTPDGAFVIGVLNGFSVANNAFDAKVVWFATTELSGPANAQRVEWQSDPSVRRPVRRIRWQPVTTVPGNAHVTALALSADGARFAVGTREGAVHVIDLNRTRKRVIASLPWPGRKVRSPWVERVALEPLGERLALLSNGKLFVRPFVGAGKGWQTTSALGELHDVAYHPTGRFVAVVGDDGRARFLDSGTSAVKHEFSWKRGPLYSVCFAPDGLTCAAGAGGARVVIWDVDL